MRKGTIRKAIGLGRPTGRDPDLPILRRRFGDRAAPVAIGAALRVSDSGLAAIRRLL
jgi:hypothetical protein